MAEALSRNYISWEEYHNGELASEIRHEYVAAKVYAMSGGTLNHQRIAENFVGMTGNQLVGKPCFPIGNAVSNFRCHSARARRLFTTLMA